MQLLRHDEDRVVHLSRLLLLSFSNRAEARLPLKRYVDALSDADRALKIDADHVKSWLQGGKALQEMGLFQKATESMRSALKLAPGEKRILAARHGSKLSCEQSETGACDLSKFLCNEAKGQAQPCAHYIGPVEVRAAGQKGRGMFTTRDVKAGEVLCVSKPLVIGHGSTELQLGKHDDRAVEMAAKCRQEFMVELVNKVKYSKRLMALQFFERQYGRQRDTINRTVQTSELNGGRA